MLGLLRSRRHPRRLGGLRRDRGASTLELVIIGPVFFGFILGIIQVAAYYHGRNVVTSAAQIGVQAARTVNATAGDGSAAAWQYLGQTAPNYLTGLTVSTSRGGGTARVEISSDAPQVIPLLPLPRISVSAAGPVEVVTRP